MRRNFRIVIISLAFSLPLLAAVWVGSIVFYNCGIYADCSRGFLAQVIHTPIPTLFPATLPGPTPTRPFVTATPTAMGAPSPTPQEEVVPEPSNPGPPGTAINLKGDPKAGETIFNTECQTCHGPKGTDNVPNPGSDDGTVPPLNPIDPLLKDVDDNTFAKNIDLFIQHGSVPEGPSPYRTMPGWGDRGVLNQQQIADVIAYIISLNK
jgi:mono/diheme cytochrome c family protein